MRERPDQHARKKLAQSVSYAIACLMNTLAQLAPDEGQAHPALSNAVILLKQAAENLRTYDGQ